MSILLGFACFYLVVWLLLGRCEGSDVAHLDDHWAPPPRVSRVDTSDATVAAKRGGR